MTCGQRAAEWMASAIGWKFLIAQTVVIIAWMALNVVWAFHADRWDPYPFILLNLGLSLQAAYTGPVLLIANKRQEELAAERDQETHDRVTEVLQILQNAHFDQMGALAEIHEKVKAHASN